MMKFQIITEENVQSVEWDEQHFKFCAFESFSVEVVHIGSDFIDCTFSDVEWYMGLFNIINFVDCTFTNCVFRGSSFPECKFVECEFKNCRFIENNLGGACKFEGARAYKCKFQNCVGFDAEIIVAAQP